MVSRLLLTLQDRSVPVRLFRSDQPFLNLDIAAREQRLDNVWIREVKPLWNCINQLVVTQRNLIARLSDQSIGLGCKCS